MGIRAERKKRRVEKINKYIYRLWDSYEKSVVELMGEPVETYGIKINLKMYSTLKGLISSMPQEKELILESHNIFCKAIKAKVESLKQESNNNE